MIKNLTPHTITLCGKVIEPAGVARCDTTVEKIAEIDGVKVNRRTFGKVVGLPEPEEGTVYIVSAIVAQAISGKRDDIFIVDETVRDDNGQIIGCNAIAKI